MYQIGSDESGIAPIIDFAAEVLHAIVRGVIAVDQKRMDRPHHPQDRVYCVEHGTIFLSWAEHAIASLYKVLRQNVHAHLQVCCVAHEPRTIEYALREIYEAKWCLESFCTRHAVQVLVLAIVDHSIILLLFSTAKLELVSLFSVR